MFQPGLGRSVFIQRATSIRQLGCGNSYNPYRRHLRNGLQYARLAMEHVRTGVELGLSVYSGSDGPRSAYYAALLLKKGWLGKKTII
jgi:hypothetical protein